MNLPDIGDTVTTAQALELCRYFGLDYLAGRIVSHPEEYRKWRSGALRPFRRWSG